MEDFMRLLLSIVLLAILSSSTPSQGFQTQGSATVKFVSVNDSKIAGKCSITQIVVNNTKALQFDCRAHGFDRDSVYASFVYDAKSLGPAGSGAVLSGAVNVCLPGILPPDPGALTIPQMIPGGNSYWQPLVGASVRTLSIVSFGANYTDLINLGTMSIRKDTAFGPVLALTPQRFPIVACGSLSF
jgi:hypothetical protein